MIRKLIPILVLFALLAALVGCAARSPEMSAPSGTMAPAQPPMAAQLEADRAAENSARSTGDTTSQDANRMIVRTADTSLVVTDAAKAQESIVQTVNDMGGYVADESAWREGDQLRARLSVRVPADRLDALLASVAALAVRVQQQNVKSQDVTEEYTDLNAQLTNLEATEKVLRELLSEVRQRTQKASDVLDVYRELTQIRGEIERVKGRMQYLSNVTALATANIELIPDELAKPVVEPGWRPLETLKSAGRTLINSLKGLVNALIWIVIYVVPLLIIIAIPIVLFVLLIRWLVRRARRPKS